MRGTPPEDAPTRVNTQNPASVRNMLRAVLNANDWWQTAERDIAGRHKWTDGKTLDERGRIVMIAWPQALEMIYGGDL